MGRPKRPLGEIEKGLLQATNPNWLAEQSKQVAPEDQSQKAPEQKSRQVFIKVCHLAIGVDLLGSKTSLSAGRSTSLEMTPIGIKAHSKNTNRTVVIPYSNVKGFELLPE